MAIQFCVKKRRKKKEREREKKKKKKVKQRQLYGTVVREEGCVCGGWN